MPRERRGVTLLEVLLVCALLAIVAAVSYPTVSSAYAGYKVRAATDSVRAALTNARTHAIEDGRSYRFSVIPGKSNYRIAPDDASYWSGSSSASDDNTPAYIIEDALPRGIRFGGLGDSGPGGSGGHNDDTVIPAGSTSPGQFTTAVVFNQDGTAQEDVEIIFDLAGAKPLVVTLRALTGSSTVRMPGKEGSK